MNQQDGVWMLFCESCQTLGLADQPCATCGSYSPAARLDNKLATMIFYLCEVRSGMRTTDPVAFESLLDDPQVQDWLDKMNKAGRIERTRFITR